MRSAFHVLLAAAGLATASCGDDAAPAGTDATVPPPPGSDGAAADVGSADGSARSDGAAPDASIPGEGGPSSCGMTSMTVLFDGEPVPLADVQSSAFPGQVSMGATTTWRQATDVVFNWLAGTRTEGTFVLPADGIAISIGVPDAGHFFVQVSTPSSGPRARNVLEGTATGSVTVLDAGSAVGSQTRGCFDVTVRWSDDGGAAHEAIARGGFDALVLEWPRPGG